MYPYQTALGWQEGTPKPRSPPGKNTNVLCTLPQPLHRSGWFPPVAAAAATDTSCRLLPSESGAASRPRLLLSQPELSCRRRLWLARRLRASAMAPLRFAANLAWLFQEYETLPQRIEAAARAGFRAVELGFPYACGDSELRAAADQAGLEVVLINIPPGNQNKGDRGLGAVPGRQSEFRETLALAVKYAKALKCPRIHIMAGRIPVGSDREAVTPEMEATFLENLRYATNILAQENLIGLLEPINSRITDPLYFLNTPQQAAAILKKVGSSNLKLQLDFFHCQIMDGNLTHNLKMYFPLIEHIQIAQIPARHEPDSPGELNYLYLFHLLETMGYNGYVGCEYAPKGDTLKGLGWLRSYWENHNVLHGENSAT